MGTGARKTRRNVLHLGRLGEIFSILIKFGLEDLLSSLPIDKYTSLTRKLFPPRDTLSHKTTRWERIRLALEELGPTFIKLGQFLSNRPDLLPASLVTELEKLQDAVLPLSPDEARRIVVEELEGPFETLVAEFIDRPIASASIAQVHKARLKTGEMVAIKIQRPRIRQNISTDMDILHQLAMMAEKRSERARALRLSQLVGEFERVVEKELDFTIEASHIERFRADFAGDERMYIPKVYPELTTKRVLTAEFIIGYKITDVQSLDAAGIDRRDVATRGTNLVLSQIFDHGFFHADPHPGNILVKADGSICFLDFGAIGIIPPSLRYHLSIIMYGVVRKDSQKIVRTLSQLTGSRVKHFEQLEYDITEFIEEYSLSSLREIDIGLVLRRFMNIIIEHGIRIIPGFYLLLKALIAVEGVGRKLDPDFHLTAHLDPYVCKLIRDSARIRRLPSDFYFTLMELGSLMKDLPFEIKDTIRIVKGGDLHIQFEHRGLEPMLSRHEQLVNKLVFAIVLASLIIGSSLVVHSATPPLMFGISAIGIVGFVMAAVIGFGLLFSIIQRRRM